MAEKIGVCDGCDARYKIPPTFKGTKAKCKKCGGVVQIDGGAPAEAAAPAERPARRTPKAEASEKAAGGGRRAGRGGRASGGGRAKAGARAGGRGRKRGGEEEEEEEAGAGGRRGRGRAPAKKNNNMLFAGLAAVLILGGGGGAFFLLGGNDDGDTVSANEKDGGDGTTDPSGDEGASNTPEEGAPEDPGTAGDQGTPPEDAGTGDADTANQDQDTTGGTEETDTTKPVEDPPPEVDTSAPLPTLIQFDSFEKLPSTTDEDWETIMAAAEDMKYSGRGRKRAMEKLVPFGLQAVPAALNTLNGIDIDDNTKWMDAYEIAVFIQDTLSLGIVKIPFHGDYSTEQKERDWNVKVLQSVVDYWAGKVSDEAVLAELLQRWEAKKAEKDG